MASVIKGRLEKNLFVTFFYALHKKEVLCKWNNNFNNISEEVLNSHDGVVET
jgi:hypothetical protein